MSFRKSLLAWCKENGNSLLLEEYKPELNDDVTADNVNCSGKIPVAWVCSECGNIWNTSPAVRTYSGCGCPVCAGRKANVTIGENDLETTNPELLAYWDYELNKIKPNEVGPTSKIYVNWKCPKCGYRFVKQVISMTKYKTKCKNCIIVERASSKGNIVENCQDILQWWDYKHNNLNPTQYTKGSKRSVWWKCKAGHSYRMSIAYRTKYASKDVCPICKFERKKLGDKFHVTSSITENGMKRFQATIFEYDDITFKGFESYIDKSGNQCIDIKFKRDNGKEIRVTLKS